MSRATNRSAPAPGVCPSEDALARWLAARLDPEASASVEAHLADCPICQAVLAVLAEPRHHALAPTLEHSGESATRMQIRTGQRVGRYRILDRLGTGAMGVVYAAEDPELRRRVAMKLVAVPEADGGAPALDRVRQEAVALAAVDDPHVVRVYDVGVHFGQLYIVMELLGGPPLQQWLSTRPSWRTIVARFVEVAYGLAAAHEAGLVHRDVKPGNVLLHEGRAVVTDFGLARAAADSDVAAFELVGTPIYMAPEVLRDGSSDARSDQFSYCVALWHALFEVWPYAPTRIPGLAAVGQSPGHPSRPRGMPAALTRMVARGLSLDPRQRHSSMRELAEGLAGVRGPATPARIAGFAAVLAIAAWALVVPADRRCRDAAAELGERWSSMRRAQIETALAGDRAPTSVELAATVVARLDARAAELVRVGGDVCVTGAQLEDPRARCVADGLRSFTALVDVLERGDGVTLEHARAGVAALPPVDACTRVGPGAVASAERDALLDELARGRALDATGHDDAAAETFATVARGASAIGDAALRAEALLELADVAAVRGRTDEAEQALHDAADEAARAGDDELAARTLVMQLWIVGAQLERHDAGELLLRSATSALRRIGDPPRLRARMLLYAASMHDGAGDVVRAREEYEEALALAATLPGPPDPVLPRISSNLALLLSSRGEAEPAIAAAERAVAWQTELSGAGNPEVAQALSNLGVVQAQAGRLREAETSFASALAVREAWYGPDDLLVADTLQNLAALRGHARDLPGAEAAAARALAIIRAHPQPDHESIVEMLELLLGLAVRGGRAEQALAHADALDLELGRAPTDAEAAILLAGNRGAAHALLGDLERAERLLGEAVARARERYGEHAPATSKWMAELAEVRERRGDDRPAARDPG